jgi:glycerol-3-phosphate acyltransferase PlsY
MDNLLVGSAVIVFGYLAGSISFSRVVTRLVSPQTDLEATLVPVEGTEDEIHMNAVSATSVRFKLGARFGCLASILDMAKVAVPVAAFEVLFPDSPAEFLAAIGGLIGHN